MHLRPGIEEGIFTARVQFECFDEVAGCVVAKGVEILGHSELGELPAKRGVVRRKGVGFGAVFFSKCGEYTLFFCVDVGDECTVEKRPHTPRLTEVVFLQTIKNIIE